MKKKVIVFVALFVVFIQFIYAQDISVENYDFMRETPQEDSLYWFGDGDITPNIFLGMITIQKSYNFKDKKKLIHWKNNSIIASAIEKDDFDEEEVVVLFYFSEGKNQRIIFYKYPYKSNYFSEDNLGEEFLLYVDYCQNNLFGDKTSEGGWLNISMYPKSVLCAKEMDPNDLSNLKKYIHLYELLMDLSY